MGLSSKLMAGFSFPVSVWVAALVVLVPFFVRGVLAVKCWSSRRRLPLAVRLGLPCVVLCSVCFGCGLLWGVSMELVCALSVVAGGVSWLLYRASSC